MIDGEYPQGLQPPQEGAEWPYPIVYAWCATRNLPIPAPAGRILTGAGKGPHWTAQEDAIVRAKYVAHRGAGTVRVLAEELNRTPLAVMTRARKLGVARPRRLAQLEPR